MNIRAIHKVLRFITRPLQAGEGDKFDRWGNPIRDDEAQAFLELAHILAGLFTVITTVVVRESEIYEEHRLR